MNQEGLECKLAQDLMTLSIDDMLGKESKDFLKQHCERCKICNSMWKNMQGEIYLPKTKKVDLKKKKTHHFQKFIVYSAIYVSLLCAVTWLICQIVSKGI